MDDMIDPEHEDELLRLPAAKRLSKDLATAARTISDAEARFLVDAYYMMQDSRIRAAGQVRSIEKNPIDTGLTDDDGAPIKMVEPHDVLSWLADQNWVLETQVKRALSKYVDGHPVGSWLTSVHGIGPVISAGLLAHIYMGPWCAECHGRTPDACKERQKAPKLKLNKHEWQPETSCPTVGHIWRFAGLDPTVVWLPKTKRPWNADLKVLCWKAGESFVKFSNSPECYYGKLWRKQKDVYISRNEAGMYAERSAEILTIKNYGKDTDAYAAYSVGRLPPAHIHAMARRYAVKLFLAHLHHVMHVRILGVDPPLPYPIAVLGHAHYIAPPAA
jgi:hypothetical protein